MSYQKDYNDGRAGLPTQSGRYSAGHEQGKQQRARDQENLTYAVQNGSLSNLASNMFGLVALCLIAGVAVAIWHFASGWYESVRFSWGRAASNAAYYIGPVLTALPYLLFALGLSARLTKGTSLLVPIIISTIVMLSTGTMFLLTFTISGVVLTLAAAWLTFFAMFVGWFDEGDVLEHAVPQVFGSLIVMLICAWIGGHGLIYFALWDIQAAFLAASGLAFGLRLGKRDATTRVGVGLLAFAAIAWGVRHLLMGRLF